ncbi:ABC transporter ATP-binding protein [Methylobacterium oryzihabitans]|uniref:ABC transporter ATP-binding protein n=2 Tax=Methylobacterium oryzihabitans TaxID=2499852 RepID=A0A437PGC1_9HYPH|nr:ABC transporter ATP-binding protein [Methylobacterium oryzihabitans]RVU21174.1 ABC transporter ATP-binding protein [Methylobacterium oryzihabitans]
MTAAAIHLDAVSKGYGPTRVLDGISLAIAPGEFTALIGPSGCGKSTLLRLIAGLDRPDRGRIRIGERDVTTVRAADRDVAMVFQSYALYPHLTARQNMAVPLVMRRLGRLQRLPVVGRWFGAGPRLAEVAREIEAAAASLRLGPVLDRRPSQMSGGQRQRVALGRAMVRHPRAFLMDEPLSNLDMALRHHMRGEIVDLHRRLGTTTVYVTHDQEEALSMADRVAVLMHGRLLQVGRPDAVYRDPAHLDVATFVGAPRINLVAGSVDADGVARRGGTALLAGLAADAPGPVQLALRPEHVVLAAESGPASLPARVERLEFQGAEILAHLRVLDGDERLTARLPAGRPGIEAGRDLHVSGHDGAWLAFGPGGERLRPSAEILSVGDRQALRHG